MTNKPPFQVHVQDQQEAAAEHARDIASFVAILRGIGPEDSKNSKSMEILLQDKLSWLKDTKSFMDAHLSEKVKTCEHVDLSHPSIYFIPLALPNSYSCPQCMRGILEKYNEKGANRFLCDYCYKKPHKNHFHEILIQAGAFMVVGNVCPPCKKILFSSDREV